MLSLIVTVLAAKATCLLFGGDIMLNGIKPSPHTLEGIQKLTAESNLSFANLEIPLTNANTRTGRKSAAELKRKDQWILKADPRHAPFIRQSGLNLVTLANNHAMDYGRDGLSEMIRVLDDNKIFHAGANYNATDALKPAVVGKKIALLSALAFISTGALRKTTPATIEEPGVAVLNFGGVIGEKARAKLESWVKSAHAQAKIVVVGIHWGIERKPLPSPYQVSLGRALIDAGADIVWGNHPHVLQGAELYKGHLIMYSMGNLISSLPATAGFFKVQIEDNGSQSVSFIPGRDAGGRITLLKSMAKTAAIRAMKKLCDLLLLKYPSAVSVPAL